MMNATRKNLYAKRPSEMSMEDTLKLLMAYAGIDPAKYDTCTMRELGLRLEQKKLIPTYCTCRYCHTNYSLGEWIRLDPTGYFMNDGERPAGQKPDLEGRQCRVCAAEVRIKAADGAPAANPMWRQW